MGEKKGEKHVLRQGVPVILSLFKQRLWGLAVIQLSLVFNLIRGRKVVHRVFTETLTGSKHNTAAPHLTWLHTEGTPRVI